MQFFLNTVTFKNLELSSFTMDFTSFALFRGRSPADSDSEMFILTDFIKNQNKNENSEIFFFKKWRFESSWKSYISWSHNFLYNI